MRGFSMFNRCNSGLFFAHIIDWFSSWAPNQKKVDDLFFSLLNEVHDLFEDNAIKVLAQTVFLYNQRQEKYNGKSGPHC